MFGRSKQAALRRAYGKLKAEEFDFERIKLYHHYRDVSGVEQTLSDRMINDLDLEEVFMSLDYTTSRVGQQYLYATFAGIPKDPAAALRFEPLVARLGQNAALRDKALKPLARLHHRGAYFLPRLIFASHEKPPRWAWVLPLLSVLSVLTLVLTVLQPVWFLAAFPILVTNLMLHYWNKNRLLGYANSLPQLFVLHRVAGQLKSLDLPLVPEEELHHAQKAIGQLKRMATLFTWENKVSDELGGLSELLMDLLKGVFLIEPWLFNRLLVRLDQQRDAIHTLFTAVGEVDVALSLAGWRKALPYHCHPTLIDAQGTWQLEALYHPLLVNPVPNDLTLTDRSVLLTGSNMSGKTTFIRAVGIAAWLGQTLNTVPARAFSGPRCQVHTAIRIGDDLLDDSSYYYEEVKAIRELLVAREGDHANLFLLDELFKGTNTLERIASGKAVLSHLQGPRQWVFCSTHDLELLHYLAAEYAFYHFTEDVAEGQLVFDYQLRPGHLQHTNAIRILEANGFPDPLIQEAQQMVEALRGPAPSPGA